jgi:hypothetical protein
VVVHKIAEMCYNKLILNTDLKSNLCFEFTAHLLLFFTKAKVVWEKFVEFKAALKYHAPSLLFFTKAKAVWNFVSMTRQI